YSDRSSRGVQPMRATTETFAATPVMQNTTPLLHARGIRKVLGQGAGQVEALKGVDLDLYPGELTLMMGPSGSGKTTLLSILGCILGPTSGELQVAGIPTEGLGPEGLANIPP